VTLARLDCIPTPAHGNEEKYDKIFYQYDKKQSVKNRHA